MILQNCPSLLYIPILSSIEGARDIILPIISHSRLIFQLVVWGSPE